jgi:hypothetical protein
VDFRRVPFGDHEFNGGLIQGLVVRVCKNDLNFMRSRAKTDEDKGLAARVSPVPRRTVDSDMYVPDARRHIERLRAKHRHDAQIFGTILDKDRSMGQRLGQRRINDDFCRRLLFGERHHGGWPKHLPCSLSYCGRRKKTAVAAIKAMKACFMIASPDEPATSIRT